jgi:hypothetical protein
MPDWMIGYRDVVLEAFPEQSRSEILIHRVFRRKMARDTNIL